jgi:hypothetical protein
MLRYCRSCRPKSVPEEDTLLTLSELVVEACVVNPAQADEVIE